MVRLAARAVTAPGATGALRKTNGALAPDRLRSQPVPEIRCIECGRVAPKQAHAKGWRAYIVDDPDEPEEMEVAVYCPECGEREFGPPERLDAA